MRLLVLAGIMQIRYEVFNREDMVLPLTVFIDYGPRPSFSMAFHMAEPRKRARRHL